MRNHLTILQTTSIRLRMPSAVILLVTLALIGMPVPTTHALVQMVGTGTPESCNEDALEAVLYGATVRFNCGGGPVTIDFTRTKIINTDILIDGSGLITLNGLASVRLFFVRPGHALTLRGLGIARGLSDAGGAIYNDGGTLQIANTTLLDNHVYPGGSSVKGGAIYNMGGTVSITNSTLSGNSATTGSGGAGGSGGSIYNDGGTLSIDRTSFSSNDAAGSGGAIYNHGGTLAITNSSFSVNSAVVSVGGTGGAIYNDGGALTVTNSTFSGNSATSGGALYHQAGTGNVINGTFSGNSASGGSAIVAVTTVTLRNSILANSSGGGNCSGLIGNGGNNIDSATSCGFGATAHSMSNTNPLLAALSGSPAFFPLAAGSLAINAGDPTVCASAVGASSFGAGGADQRGMPRRSGYCDIGAFEAQAATLSATSGTPQSAGVNAAFPVALSVNVKDERTNALGGAVVRFTSLGTSAGANLSSGTATSNPSGTASVNATANGIGGTYVVRASVGSLTANFDLTNTYSGPTLTSYGINLPLIVR